MLYMWRTMSKIGSSEETGAIARSLLFSADAIFKIIHEADTRSLSVRSEGKLINGRARSISNEATESLVALGSTRAAHECLKNPLEYLIIGVILAFFTKVLALVDGAI